MVSFNDRNEGRTDDGKDQEDPKTDDLNQESSDENRFRSTIQGRIIRTEELESLPSD
jgi:hypothetical protein